MKVIFIYHYGRCGSTVLAEILDTLPNVIHFNEYLSLTSDFTRFPASRDLLSRKDGSKNAPKTIARAMLADVKSLSSSRKMGAPDYVFFELKVTDFIRRAIEGSLDEFIKKFSTELPIDLTVHLLRLNVLRLALSHMQGHKTGVWHSVKEVSPSKLRIEPEEMRRRMLGFSISAVAGNSDISKFTHLNVIYERDIFSDPYKALERIFACLGALPEPISLRKHSISLRKTNDFPLAEIVENYGDVLAMTERLNLFPQLTSDDQTEILEAAGSEIEILSQIVDRCKA